MVTKSGGNLFSGSFRDTLNNDNWRTLVPKRDGDTFANDSKIDKVIPTYGYTFGGPVAKDRLWFFAAGRLQTQESNRQLVITNIPYMFTDQIKRFEEKVTYSVSSAARFEGTVTTVKRAQLNNTFNQSQSMDLNSIYDRKLPEDLFTLNYNGILTPRLFVEARYSQRHFSFIGDGARSPIPRRARCWSTRPAPPLLGGDVLRCLRSREAGQPGDLREGHVSSCPPRAPGRTA